MMVSQHYKQNLLKHKWLLAHCEISKKYGKSFFLIHQFVDSNIFESIIEQETSKEAWNTLKKQYDGNKKLKKVKLQYFRKQYENLQTKNDETIAEFFLNMVTLKNQMKSFGENTFELYKVLRDLPSKFDHILQPLKSLKICQV